MNLITFNSFDPNVVANQHNFDLIEIENAFCHAVIARQGAQLISFERKIKNVESALVETKSLLWCSELSLQQFAQAVKNKQATKPIRGGIPLCFPWFGGHPNDAKLPAHGFARTQYWELQSIQESAQGHQLSFTLHHNSVTEALWQHAFCLTLRITCGEQLRLELVIENQGENAFECEFAWHSYFPVNAIENMRIDGLHGKSFLDQLTNEQLVQEHGQILFDQETDRIYQDVDGHYQIFDALQQINIATQHCQSAIVWNPWIEKTKRLGDVDVQAWRDFVCLECANVRENRLHIAAGASAEFSMTIS